MGRFASVGVTSSAALRSTGADACGLAAATAVNGAKSAPMAAAYSSRVWPSRARRALSIRAYWLGAPISPWAAWCRDIMPDSPYPRSSRLPSACSVKSGLSWPSCCRAKCSMVEMASEPKIRVTSLSPAAITRANSLTRCWGAWPPLTSSTARAGVAAIRPATDRG